MTARSRSIVCIPARNVIAIDESLPEDVVSFFDAFGNATHTALMFPLIGEDVLITGAGPIGIIAGGICKYAGARRVVITDVNEYRLDLARKMGVDAAVNTAKEDLREVMHEQGLTEGFDVGLEMSGNAAAFHQMISVMRSGGKISLLGLGDGPISVDMNQIIYKRPDAAGHLRPQDGQLAPDVVHGAGRARSDTCHHAPLPLHGLPEGL